MPILGLRALYFALAAILHRFAYLKQALAVLLVFIARRFSSLTFRMGEIHCGMSLGITFVILASGIGHSLWRTSMHNKC